MPDAGGATRGYRGDEAQDESTAEAADCQHRAHPERDHAWSSEHPEEGTCASATTTIAPTISSDTPNAVMSIL